MNNDELRIVIAALFSAHPDIAASPAGHNDHAKRFRTRDGAQIGWQDELKSKHNIYVERDRINLTKLADIEYRLYLSQEFGRSMPNHDLFHADAFSKERDIVAFSVRDLWQAVRILVELTA